MIGDWTAVAVRARGLAGRRLGRDGARSLARSGSFDEALATLCSSPYGHDVRRGMDLAAAEHAVASTFLWHLRILAGWAPSQGLGRVRLLAGGFEIANILGRLAQLDGAAATPAYELGALTTAWTAIAQAQSKEAVRSALETSPWGDPGGSDSATVALALQASWMRRVAFGVPEAAIWARQFAGTLYARMLAAGSPPAPGSATERDLRLVLGGRSAGHATLPDPAGDELWLAEARVWSLVETRARSMQASWRPGPAAVVAVAGLLGVDAWRTRAALEAAARGGEPAAQVFDVVA